MRRAISKMLEIGFDYYDCNKIYIRCATTNKRSCNIPQKLGFVHEGVFREDILVNGVKMDANIYSILRWEWEESR
jgi:RimJ/RimL family protein N-acetyltransferase